MESKRLTLWQKLVFGSGDWRVKPPGSKRGQTNHDG
jgi:hypothetical protein